VLRLRSSVEAGESERFTAALRELGGVKRVVAAPDDTHSDRIVFVGDVEPHAADELVAAIAELGITVDDYVLERIDVVAPERRHLIGGGDMGGFAWVEVMGQARANSRPLARYLALITVAAVIAALGVIKSDGILIVGAMAVSPDLLPVCATCVGLVAGRRRLSALSFASLVVGLGSVVVTAAVLTFLLKVLGFLPDGFDVDDTLLSGLTSTDYSTVLIALAAGVAAILSFETRASAAVGVAISVTTIPASAYLGVAIGSGNTDQAPGALLVLIVNVGLLIVSGSATLLLQRWLAERSGHPDAGGGGVAGR
jgi:uncharacterized hydrophobic protein (TIGR00271 family)